MQQNLNLHKPSVAVSPETMEQIRKDRAEGKTYASEKMVPVNAAEIPSLLMQALAQLTVTMAEMVETLSEIADSHDELVWLAEKAALREGIVTREELAAQNAEEKKG